MRLILSLAACLLTASAAHASEPTTIPDHALRTAAELRERALADTIAYALVEELTTTIGPRLAGSDNDLKAREWMLAKFRELGFDKVWSEPVTFPKWVRRSERAAIVEPSQQALVISALGHSVATPAGGLRAPIVAFESLDALAAADADAVAGKIVYIGPRMQRSREGRGYGVSSSIRSRGPSVAAQKGAAAFLLRSAGTSQARVAHTGVTRFADGVAPIPAAALSNPDADQIERLLKRGTAVIVRLDIDVGFEGDYTGANVIGEITGRNAEAHFLTGGHLDSWDPGTGAIDDATGIGITTAAAHLIAQLPGKPARSIRVVAFANEEAGLYGGKAYAERHRATIGNAILGSESDLGTGRIHKVTATVKPEARAAIARIAEALAPLGITYDAHAPGAGGSDLSAVHAVGMAGLSLHQDATTYFDLHHSASDTLDKVEIDALRQNVAAYAVAIHLAIEAEGDFGSAPGAFARDAEPR